MLFVVDTSSLIVLEKLSWLDELCHVDDTWLCPSEVFQELKKDRKLLQWLKERNIAIIKAERPVSITELSQTDVEVISLALEKGGCILSEDKPLGQKAERMEIPVYNIGSLVMLFYQYGRIDQSNCLERLTILANENFISQTLYRQLLKCLKP